MENEKWKLAYNLNDANNKCEENAENVIMHSERLRGPITHRPQDGFVGEMEFWFTLESPPHQSINIYISGPDL